MKDLFKTPGKLAVMLILIAVIGFMMACNEPTNATRVCSHDWEWKETRPATKDADGEKTETCLLCGVTRGKETIPRLTDDDPDCEECEEDPCVCDPGTDPVCEDCEKEPCECGDPGTDPVCEDCEKFPCECGPEPDPSSKNMTFNITMNQITDLAPNINSDVNIYKIASPGKPAAAEFILPGTLASYTSIEWYVNGVQDTSENGSLTYPVNANDFNTVTNSVTVKVVIDENTYNKNVYFNVYMF